MHMKNSNSWEGEVEAFVEVDPTGRFGRYNDLPGCGAVKNIYTAYDQEEDIEVALKKVRLTNFSEDPVLINFCTRKHKLKYITSSLMMVGKPFVVMMNPSHVKEA
ncbi:hypothetical protein SESBI_39977 [Sesbania bispinosa]|nr:hypothetical protein SESBI_39977 [Sesbania bispinosa]